MMTANHFTTPLQFVHSTYYLHITAAQFSCADLVLLILIRFFNPTFAMRNTVACSRSYRQLVMNYKTNSSQASSRDHDDRDSINSWEEFSDHDGGYDLHQYQEEVIPPSLNEVGELLFEWMQLFKFVSAVQLIPPIERSEIELNRTHSNSTVDCSEPIEQIEPNRSQSTRLCLATKHNLTPKLSVDKVLQM